MNKLEFFIIFAVSKLKIISAITTNYSAKQSQFSRISIEIIVSVLWTRKPLDAIFSLSLSLIIIITDQHDIIINSLTHLNAIHVTL